MKISARHRIIGLLICIVLVALISVLPVTTTHARAGREYSIYLPIVRSPGPGRIAFTAAMSGSSDIYTINDDGSLLMRLGVISQIAGRPLNPVWSPDGQNIAFTALNSLKNTSTIYITHADGTGLTPLTTSQSDSQPVWSPDGQRIAFVSTRAGNSRLYVMRADGSQQTILTTPGSDENDSQPAWSPDGQRVAFMRISSSSSTIYLVNANGDQPIRLTDGNATSLAWSPNGQQIACVINNALYLVQADGSGLSRLAGAPQSSYSGFAWSPDSQHIVFAASQNGNYDLYAIAVNDSRPTRLTTNPADDISPLWLSHGTRLAFLSYSSDHWAIVMMRADGTQQQRIAPVAVTSWPLTWSPFS